MADRLPSDDFMKALLCHTFSVPQDSQKGDNMNTDWDNLRPDGSSYRESEYDKMKRQKDALAAKEKARIINEHELQRGGMRFAWLIEGAPGTYWIGRGSAEFGRDLLDAVQFARLEDGERVLQWLVPRAVAAVCRVVEHGFELPPRPVTPPCEICGAPMDDGKLHSIPGNDKELCSHIKGM